MIKFLVEISLQRYRVYLIQTINFALSHPLYRVVRYQITNTNILIIKYLQKMANWFECKVRYDKMMENGVIKKVTEPYLVDALSFTEAEARIIEEQTPFISGEFSVSAVKRSKIAEIFRDDSADKWYLVKVAFITIDEKTAVEKRSVSQILVAASDFKGALDNFLEGMKSTMADYEIVSISETPLVDVYDVKLPAQAEKPQA